MEGRALFVVTTVLDCTINRDLHFFLKKPNLPWTINIYLNTSSTAPNPVAHHKLLKHTTKPEAHHNQLITTGRLDWNSKWRIPASARAKYSQLSSALPASNVRNELRAVTILPHSAPELVDVQRKIEHFERKDVLRLTGNLYLLPGYDSKRDGPLPVFAWAYPREYKSAKLASQMRVSPFHFVRMARMPLYW